MRGYMLAFVSPIERENNDCEEFVFPTVNYDFLFHVQYIPIHKMFYHVYFDIIRGGGADCDPK